MEKNGTKKILSKDIMGLSYFMWFLKYLILDLIVRSADDILIINISIIPFFTP